MLVHPGDDANITFSSIPLKKMCFSQDHQTSDLSEAEQSRATITQNSGLLTQQLGKYGEANCAGIILFFPVYALLFTFDFGKDVELYGMLKTFPRRLSSIYQN